ncbi:MAG TPA: RIO1 family regulatory kinase/ATPase [Allocoleopsis sp.]
MNLNPFAPRRGKFKLIPNIYNRKGRRLAIQLNQGDRKKRRKARRKTRRKLLGQGYWGKVYRQNHFAVRKELRPYPIINRRKIIQKEARILKRLHGTGVAPKLYGTGKNHLDMEFVPGRRLRASVKNDPRQQRVYGKRLARSVKKMHNRGIYHGDLYDHNITVTNSGKVKILDYGLAKDKQRSLTRKEREREISRTLSSYRGKRYRPLRSSFETEYKVERYR